MKTIVPQKHMNKLTLDLGVRHQRGQKSVKFRHSYAET